MSTESVNQANVFSEFVRKIKGDVLGFGLRIVIAFVIFLVAGKLIKWIRSVAERELGKRNVSEGKIKVADSVIKITLYAFVLLSLFGYLGIEISSIFAILASVGLTAGLAFQGALSNFAGGILILTARPFKIGDFITVPSQNLEGTVKDMGIIYTKILTLDNKMVILPNGSLANQNIINASSMKNRLLELNVAIDYFADIDGAREAAIKALTESGKLVKNTKVEVYVSELAESSVNLLIRCWVSSRDYLYSKWALMEAIKKEFDNSDIGFPFPQMDVHMK